MKQTEKPLLIGILFEILCRMTLLVFLVLSLHPNYPNAWIFIIIFGVMWQVPIAIKLDEVTNEK